MSWWGHIDGYIHVRGSGRMPLPSLKKELGFDNEDVYLEFPPACSLAKRVHLYNTIEKEDSAFRRTIPVIVHSYSDYSVVDRTEIELIPPVRGSENTLGIGMSVFSMGVIDYCDPVYAVNIQGDLRDFYGEGDKAKLRAWWLQALQVLGGSGMLRVSCYDSDNSVEIWIDDKDPIVQKCPLEDEFDSEDLAQDESQNSTQSTNP